LPKFIAPLRVLQQGSNNDAPDEAGIDPTTDAVRILTIHSAKGLEAPIVVLLDANHSEPARDDIGILCNWPQDAEAPTHFSGFGRKSERGAARDALFRAEEKFKAQEDWNLLYVAATRAKRMLIVSGVAGAKSAGPDGVVEGSWYARLRIDSECPRGVAVAAELIGHEEYFTLPIFEPPLLAPVAPDVAAQMTGGVIDEGVALHALLERLTHLHEWPVAVPDAELVARWLSCSRALAVTVRRQAQTILEQPQLERFFNSAQHLFARNEMEVMAQQQLLRFDRVVMFEDAVWILDYKRNFLERERQDYEAQLAQYREAAKAVFPSKNCKTALITADGSLWEFG
jgi:ATP-dependent helicase/nuclease subunit A